MSRKMKHPFDSPEGEWLMDAVNPMTLFDNLRKPTAKGVAQAAFVPAIMFGGAAVAAAFSSMPGQGITLSRFGMLRADMIRHGAKDAYQGAKFLGRHSPLIFGAAVLGSTVRGIETGRIEETPAGIILNPLVKKYMSSTKKDTGYELFEYSR